MIEEKLVCLNHVTERCPNCKIDYNPNHHPNNKDCENQNPIIVRYFEVKK
jgi:hypothetical protein